MSPRAPLPTATSLPSAPGPRGPAGAASRFPLEPGRQEMEAMGRAALDLVIRFIEERQSAPAADTDPAADLVRGLASQPPPDPGGPIDPLLERIEEAAAKGLDTAGPGYLAYIPGGGLFAAAIAELIACGLNRFVTMAAVAPGFAAIEASVLTWLCRVFGLPRDAHGILTSGGSMANFSAVLAARSLLPDDFLTGTLYMSEQAHHSLGKAARLAGFPASSVRPVPCDRRLRIDAAAAERMVEEDRAGGRRPFLLVGTAGTTNTGAVDPLGDLAEVARRNGLWFHVDAAYGGFFQLTDRGRALLGGIENADSITLDPHKGMFLPYGTGCLLVRDRERLRRAHSVDATYLQDLPSEADIPNYAELSPELSREFRGLRVWLPLHLHGVDAFRAALDEKLDLAALVHERLRDMPALEVPSKPDLSTVAFRLREGDDEANRAFLARINASRRIFISSTVLDGRFTLRVSVLSHRTHRERIEEGIEIIRRAAAS